MHRLTLIALPLQSFQDRINYGTPATNATVIAGDREYNRSIIMHKLSNAKRNEFSIAIDYELCFDYEP